MIVAFHVVDDMTTWTRIAERFRQRPGETIRSCFDRFDLEIVETFPNFGISELLYMQIFSQGIHQYFRLPRHKQRHITISLYGCTDMFLNYGTRLGGH